MSAQNLIPQDPFFEELKEHNTFLFLSHEALGPTFWWKIESVAYSLEQSLCPVSDGKNLYCDREL
jgi:hypothetical protein